MANEMPSSKNFSGRTRSVLEYSEAFSHIIARVEAGTLKDEDWGVFEKVVDVENFGRHGVFGGPFAEIGDWESYKSRIIEYGGQQAWEGTLRNVSEANGRVILELEERCSSGANRTVANTVTIYEFNDQGKIRHLDVYVMPLEASAVAVS